MHLNEEINVIKWVETCYDNTNGQIYFYENIKTQVIVCSCLEDIHEGWPSRGLCLLYKNYSMYRLPIYKYIAYTCSGYTYKISEKYTKE